MTFKSTVSGLMVENEVLYKESISVTVSELQNLVSNNILAPSQLYRITNSFHGGDVFVRAISNNQISTDGSWIKSFDTKAFGFFILDFGNTGSVTGVNVDGVNQLTSPVVYNTSLQNTISLIASNINANPSAVVRAVNCNRTLVLVYKVGGVLNNAKTVSTTVTGNLNIILSSETKNGYNSVVKNLDVKYNLSIDRFYYCSDEKNNIIEVNLKTSDTVDIYNDFRWADTRNVNNNYISSPFHYDVFVYGDGTNVSYSLNSFTEQSYLQNFLLASTNTGTPNVKLEANSFRNFSFSSQCSFVSTGNANFSFLDCSSFAFITSNTIFAQSNCTISNCFLNNSSQINSVNINPGNGGFDFRRNSLLNSSRIQTISQTTPGFISNNISFLDNYLDRLSSINTLSITDVGTEFRIVNNNFFVNGTITNITFNTSSQVNIINNTMLNQGFIRNFTANCSGNFSIGNCLFQSSGFALQSLVMTGTSNVIITNCVFGIPNTNYGFTIVSDLTTISNIIYTENQFRITTVKSGLNNTANNGAINSPINIAYIPQRFIPTEAIFEINSTYGGATNIQIGIETDNPTCILPVTLASTINGIITRCITNTVKATTATRRIQLIPTTSSINTGSFKVTISGVIGS